MERSYEINPSLQVVGRGRISTRPMAVRWYVPTTFRIRKRPTRVRSNETKHTVGLLLGIHLSIILLSRFDDHLPETSTQTDFR